MVDTGSRGGEGRGGGYVLALPVYPPKFPTLAQCSYHPHPIFQRCSHPAVRLSILPPSRLCADGLFSLLKCSRSFARTVCSKRGDTTDECSESNDFSLAPRPCPGRGGGGVRVPNRFPSARIALKEKYCGTYIIFTCSWVLSSSSFSLFLDFFCVCVCVSELRNLLCTEYGMLL